MKSLKLSQKYLKLKAWLATPENFQMQPQSRIENNFIAVWEIMTIDLDPLHDAIASFTRNFFEIKLSTTIISEKKSQISRTISRRMLPNCRIFQSNTRTYKFSFIFIHDLKKFIHNI